jgi:ATP-dependent Clp protease ATP-binding subunit ClpC
LRESFEDYHNLIIDDSAIEDAVNLSMRYITDRFLPDKAIDLVDEACSAKSMKYNYEEENVKEIKLEIEKIQKDMEGFVMSQQYHKAIIAKEKRDELESKIKEKRSKVKIPREKRLHITAEDIQRIVNQIT